MAIRAALIAPHDTPTTTSYAYSYGCIISVIAFKAPTSNAPLVPPPRIARARHLPSLGGTLKSGSIPGGLGTLGSALVESDIKRVNTAKIPYIIYESLLICF